jgi:hypothetical protein
MKKCIVLICMAFIAATSFGQKVTLAPQVFENTVRVNGNFTQSKGKIFGGKQTISAARDTVKGYELVVVTAARKDTIVLNKTLYTTGQTFKLLCTASANDSTYIITTSGNINAASTYWFTGTYKAVTFYFDGTNYWILK